MTHHHSIQLIHVDCSGINQRLDSWLASKQTQLNRSQIKKQVIQQQILLNQKPCRPNTRLTLDDQIQYHLMPDDTKQLFPRQIPLDILFEDNHILVLNKPANLSVHPGAGHGQHITTLVEGLLAHTNLSTLPTDKQRPGIVHRLDKDTTGVMVCAKSDQAHEQLLLQFYNKENTRTYIALLDGYMEDVTLTYTSYLYRDPKNRLRFASSPTNNSQETPKPIDYQHAKWSQSSFKKLMSFGHRITLVAITLHTGRTHQIRVHSKALGMPVLGDPLYNHPKSFPKIFSKDLIDQLLKLKRQLLHAQSLGIKHPLTQESLDFNAPLPSDFKSTLKLLKKYQN